MDFHLVAWVVLEREGQVLLARRAGVDYGAGLWGLPGGHVEASETLTVAAAREAAEEVGVHVYPADLVPLGVTRYTTPDMQGTDFFFRARRFTGEPWARSECDAVAWCAPDALPPDALPWLSRALTRHLLDGHWLDESVDAS